MKRSNFVRELAYYPGTGHPLAEFAPDAEIALARELLQKIGIKEPEKAMEVLTA